MDLNSEELKWWSNPHKFKRGDYVVCEAKGMQAFTFGRVYKVDGWERSKPGVNEHRRYLRMRDDTGRKNGLAPGWFRPATATELVLYTTKE